MRKVSTKIIRQFRSRIFHILLSHYFFMIMNYINKNCNCRMLIDID